MNYCRRRCGRNCRRRTNQDRLTRLLDALNLLVVTAAGQRGRGCQLAWCLAHHILAQWTTRPQLAWGGAILGSVLRTTRRVDRSRRGSNSRRGRGRADPNSLLDASHTWGTVRDDISTTDRSRRWSRSRTINCPRGRCPNKGAVITIVIFRVTLDAIRWRNASWRRGNRRYSYPPLFTHVSLRDN